MATIIEMLRDLDKDANYIAVHESDSSLKRKAHAMHRTIQKIMDEIDPKPPSDGYDWGAIL